MRATATYILATFVLMSGCRRQDDDFTEAAPEEAALAMEVTGDANSEGFQTTSEADWGEATQALSTTVPEYLRHTRDAVRALNQAVAQILRPIARAIIASAPKTQAGDVRVWPAQDHGNATYRFIMKRLDFNTFGWRLDGKPKGADDSAYVQVMGGLFTKGALPHRGRGVMGIDLDKVAMVDSAFKGSGQLLVGFAHVLGYKVLAYGLKGFSPDVTLHDPVDAVFAGWKGPLGVIRVRLAVNANIADSATSAKELVLLRARWLPGEGGRADAIALRGDVPADRAIVANSCWNRDLEDGVKGFLLIRNCPIGQFGTGCTVIRTEGAPINCVRGVDAEELPPLSPMDPTQEPGAPGEEPIPQAIPSGE